MTRRPFLIAMAVLAVILLVALLGIGPFVPGSVRAQQILAAAWSDAGRTPYLAMGETAVRVQGGWLRSGVRVFADGRRERYEYTTGAAAGAVVCCDDGHRWRRTAQGTVVSYPLESGMSPAASPQIERIAGNYRFVFGGRSQVAGRQAHVVTLIARDTHRRVRRLWVDAERSVVLATTQYDARGRPAAWTRYSQIAFRPGLEVPLPPAGAESHEAAADKPAGDVGTRLGFRPAAPHYLPAGYLRVGSPEVVDCPCGCSGVTEVRRYTDGVRSFSLFQTDLRRHHCDLGAACQHGRECGHGCRATRYGSETVVARRLGSVAVVAVGDLSMGELRRVVASL